MNNTWRIATRIWQCHPNAARVIPAEKTLQGTANKDALKFCGPYTMANQCGWWLFPPVDVDICWRGEREFEHKLLEPYSSADYDLICKLLTDTKEKRGELPHDWAAGGRTKFTFGSVEPGVVQFWTGCIFETPPGWSLHIRSPINTPPQPYYVMEGIIESDWLQYDIWVNLVFTQPGRWVSLRKNQWPPMAQLIPIPRETYDSNWKLESEMINRDTPEANRVFEYWVYYNQEKFSKGGKQLAAADGSRMKDSTTYYRERKRILGNEHGELPS